MKGLVLHKFHRMLLSVVYILFLLLLLQYRELMKSVRSGGSLSLPCRMESMVLWFVIDSHKVECALTCFVTLG